MSMGMDQSVSTISTIYHTLKSCPVYQILITHKHICLSLTLFIPTSKEKKNQHFLLNWIQLTVQFRRILL